MVDIFIYVNKICIHNFNDGLLLKFYIETNFVDSSWLMYSIFQFNEVPNSQFFLLISPEMNRSANRHNLSLYDSYVYAAVKSHGIKMNTLSLLQCYH